MTDQRNRSDYSQTAPLSPQHSENTRTTADHTAHSAQRQSGPIKKPAHSDKPSPSGLKLDGGRTTAEWCEQDAGTLNQLLARARAFERLNQIVSQSLPENLAQHSRIACIRDQTLIIQADSAAWGTRVRLQGELWLNAVRQYWPGAITQMKIKVQTKPVKPTKVDKPRVLSDQVCDHLKQCAANQKDQEMAAILQRLAQYSNHTQSADTTQNTPASGTHKPDPE